jgi:FixJ family two-component response regulator
VNRDPGTGPLGPAEKQIAAKLGISDIIVRAHGGRVLGKMRDVSLADLVRVAAVLGVELAEPI